MAVIYMKHPIHGAKVATLELEAQYDESLGWVRYTPEVVIETPDFLKTPEESENQLKRGKRKTAEV